MSNDMMMKMQEIGLANIMELSLPSQKPEGGFQDTYEVSRNFFSSAALLPKGAFLGWQLSVDQEGHGASFIFSSAGAEVTTEDFAWMFQGYATAKGHRSLSPMIFAGSIESFTCSATGRIRTRRLRRKMRIRIFLIPESVVLVNCSKGWLRREQCYGFWQGLVKQAERPKEQCF